MKKAYKITPEQYRKNLYEIREIGYKNGWSDPNTGICRLANNTNPRTRKRFENLKKECDEMPIPKDKTFFLGTDIYNLWLNRDTDEPVTARELYNIVADLSKAISDAKSSSSYYGFDASRDCTFF